jgi:pyruvate/2-oxoglutarate dehydrogenase complex dihydrolipoamide acyltransferase (E2) component
MVHPILPLSLTFDHRAIDGDSVLSFLGELRAPSEAFRKPAIRAC